MAALQGGRPVRTHATVFTTSDIDGLIERVAARGVRHRVDPPGPDLPHPRLWVGVAPDEPAAYRPDDDAGLIFECIPTQGLLMPADAFATPPPQPGEETAEGAFVRIVARQHLVADLDAALRTLAERLDLEADGPVSSRADGSRVARIGVTMANSAVLELVEPAGGDAAASLAAWGPGPHATTFSVNGLGAKADDLRRRGVGFTIEHGEDGDELVVDPAALDGAIIRLVDHR
jgi:hypothetical protein